MLTKELFDKIPYSEVFATGVLPNSSEGIFANYEGGELRWVAKKGSWNDWAIYYHWSHKDEQWIKEHGDKLYNKVYIKRCVPCTEEVLNMYRF